MANNNISPMKYDVIVNTNGQEHDSIWVGVDDEPGVSHGLINSVRYGLFPADHGHMRFNAQDLSARIEAMKPDKQRRGRCLKN